MRLWGPDPVHPTETDYDQLADTLLGKVAMAGRERKGSNSSTLEAPPGTKKRKRSPSVDRRPSWISESVTEVGRRPHSLPGRGGHQNWSPAASGSGYSNSANRGTGGYRGARGRGGPRGGHASAGPSSGRGLSGYGGRQGTHSGNAGTRHGSRKRY